MYTNVRSIMNKGKRDEIYHIVLNEKIDIIGRLLQKAGQIKVYLMLNLILKDLPCFVKIGKAIELEEGFYYILIMTYDQEKR